MNNDQFVENSPVLTQPTPQTVPVQPVLRDYPVVIVDRKSANVVALLKNAVFGKNSEMTALTSYLYQSWITSPQNGTLAKSLENMSMQEMHHLDLLASAIVAFGGNPNYSNSNGAFWQGNYVNFCNDTVCLLRNNIAAERRAIADYRALQQQITNQSLRDLISRIIEDEQEHIRIFETYLAELNA